MNKIHVNILFYEALEQMPIYAKTIKELLSRKKKLKHDKNIALVEDCIAIIQRKLPPKFTDLGSFIIPFSTGSLTIGRALCDLVANINLISLYMTRKLNYG